MTTLSSERSGSSSAIGSGAPAAGGAGGGPPGGGAPRGAGGGEVDQPVATLQRRLAGAAVVDDLHAEAAGPLRDLSSDAAQPDDAERRAVQVAAQQDRRPPALPERGPHVAVALGRGAGA